MTTGAGKQTAGRPGRGALPSPAWVERIVARFAQSDQVWGTYALDLTLEALLACARAGGDVRYRDLVFSILRRRALPLEDPRCTDQQPFVHLAYEVYLATGEESMARQFVATSRRVMQDVLRDGDGLVLHVHGAGRSACVLVDFMQDYVARMARAWSLSGERMFLDEAVDQVQRHRNVLRDPVNGLWHQGRGWEPSDSALLSPGAWSRGQGWIAHGLSRVLPELEKDPPARDRWKKVLRELLDALLACQRSDGLWSCLPDLPPEESAPEVSGTAMIAAACYRIQEPRYRARADLALAALPQWVLADGSIRGVCAGPGPLTDALRRDGYWHRAFAEQEDHGPFSLLHAAAAHGWPSL